MLHAIVDLRRFYTRSHRFVVFATLCVHFGFVSELRTTCALLSAAVSPHLFVQTLQLHLQALQEALPLDQLALRSSQGLVALLHLALQRVQLGDGIQAVVSCEL